MSASGVPSPSDFVLKDEYAGNAAMPDPILITAKCKRRSHGRWTSGLQSRLTNELTGDARVVPINGKRNLIRVFVGIHADRDKIKARIRMVIKTYLARFDRRKSHPCDTHSDGHFRDHPLPRRLHPQPSCGGAPA